MATEFDYSATDTPDDVVRRVAAEMSGTRLKPLSDEERRQREIWREQRAEEYAWQSAQRRIDQERHESEERAAANRRRATAAAEAREKARQEYVARQEQQRRSSDLSALRSEALEQGQWRNLVKSSLWHQQTQNILNELHQMVNPPAPQPDGLQILDELRGEVADLKRQLEEDRNPDYPKLHSWHR